MRVMVNLAFFVGCTLLAYGAGGNEDNPPPSQILLSRARMQQDAWVEGTPPTLVRGTIWMSAPKGDPLEGSYAFYWISPTRWREEIRLADYSRTRVRQEKGYWQKSSMDHKPEAIFQVETVLGIRDVLRLAPKQSLSKAKARKKAGAEQYCFDVRYPTGTNRTLCLDAKDARLMSVDYPQSSREDWPLLAHVEYSEFAKVGERQIPTHLQGTHGGKPFVDVKLTEITPVPHENAQLLAALPDGEFWERCDEPEVGDLLEKVPPAYPEASRLNFEQGVVDIYAVVEKDGSLSNLKTIKSATAILDKAAIEAVRHWRYKPTLCGTVPIRIETRIEVHFSLAR